MFFFFKYVALGLTYYQYMWHFNCTITFNMMHGKMVMCYWQTEWAYSQWKKNHLKLIQQILFVEFKCFVFRYSSLAYSSISREDLFLDSFSNTRKMLTCTKGHWALGISVCTWCDTDLTDYILVALKARSLPDSALHLPSLRQNHDFL